MDEILRKLLRWQFEHDGIPQELAGGLPAEEKALLDKRADGKFALKESERKRVKVVMAGGVFDLLHAGHVYSLYEAKKQGDFLVVVVATDVVARKKREPVHSQEYRRFIVDALKPVDVAVIGTEERGLLIPKIKPGIIVFGYDQKVWVPESPAYQIVRLSDKLKENEFKTTKIIEQLGL